MNLRLDAFRRLYKYNQGITAKHAEKHTIFVKRASHVHLEPA
jgi:hypothetical protein